MLLSLNTPIPGFDAPCPSGSQQNQVCRYHLDIGTSGSDANDQPYLLTAVYVRVNNVVQKVTLPPDPPDMRDNVATEIALNALGLGTFRVNNIVATNGDPRTAVSSENNPNDLVGIEVTYDGATSDEPFCKEDCITVNICDPANVACDYTLSRRYESDPGYSKISITSIEFTHRIANTQPIDTANLANISAWLNGLPEAQGNKFNLRYEAETLYIFGKGLTFEPLKATFQVESANLITGSTQTDIVETAFVKGTCRACCPTPCGAAGQLPCNNGAVNGCNTGLIPDRDNICRPPCKPGYAWFGDTLVSAGGFGQPADCAGNCQAGLVATPYGCRPQDESVTKCTLNFNTVINASGKFVGIKLCNLGTFKPLQPIVYGNGTAISAWINDPTTGICPSDAPCATVTRTTTEAPNVYTYNIVFEGVNFDCHNTDNPIMSDYPYCPTELTSCISPTCQQLLITPDCPAGQYWDKTWLRCISVSTTDKCKKIDGTSFAAKRCRTAVPTTDSSYEMARANKINAKIAEIKANTILDTAVQKWFADRGLSVDYTSYAINALVAIGGANGLPEWEEICFYDQSGKRIIQ